MSTAEPHVTAPTLGRHAVDPSADHTSADHTTAHLTDADHTSADPSAGHTTAGPTTADPLDHTAPADTHDGRHRRFRTLRRRSLSVPAVIVAFVVLAPLLVVGLPVLALLDVVRGERTLPRARLAAFGIWYLGWEVVAVASASVLWVATGFGRWVAAPWSARVHHGLQVAWVGSLLSAAQRLLRLDLDVTGADAIGHAPGDGPLVVLCRHASMVDTLVPAKLLFDRGYRVRYVLKDELLWDPALDIVGHRLPNCFVDRGSTDMAAELDGIGALAADAGPGDALVIFPEGTRWSATKRQRAIERLTSSDPEAATRAEALTHTLPPRPGGTLALLAGRPDADVVIVAHTGLEGLAGPGDALRLLPLRRPMQLDVRRVDRASVPATASEQQLWLWERWAEVDDWVRDHTA